MSLPVALSALGKAVEERGPGAYLLTVSDDGGPHAVHTPVRVVGDVLVADVGTRSAANAAARPSVSLLFPVRADGDYSLIVDGVAAVAHGAGGPCVRVTPTRAVLHRPAVVADPTSSCAGDCVPLVSPPPERS
jgi:hypothetical protein